jgi:choline monooxygenase
MNHAFTGDPAFTLIKPQAYYEDSILDEEIDKVFLSRYQFVCMTADLAKHRDFATLTIPGLAAVVQNFNGQLKAFHNVCSHRFNLIQWEERGNRPLTCRYHGWSFDADGNPVGDKACRVIAGETTREALRLKRLKVEVCGKFVFVGGESIRHSLREQLGDYMEVLERLSASIGQEIYYGHVAHAANWKLLVENVLECLHCSRVHPETFVARLGVGRIPAEQVVFSGANSSFHAPADHSARNSKMKYLSHLERRNLRHESFYHIHIMPNLFIASSEGMSFYVGHAIPEQSGQTSLKVRYFEPEINFSDQEKKLQEMINEKSVKLGLQILEEDRLILENVQRGIRVANLSGALDREEIRIGNFMQCYHSMMTV